MPLDLPDDLRALIGKRVHLDNYLLIQHKGSGKRGHVFKAEGNHGEVRALKFIPRSKMGPQWTEEAYKAHVLEQQPNTVKFYDLFFELDYGVMVFDFIDGPSLRTLIDNGLLTVNEIEVVLYNLLFFRRDCLEKRVRHGDLHPGNILIRRPTMGPPRGYDVMVTDFGIGFTGAVLEPKEDLDQIGKMATWMLQSVRREDLDHFERLVYGELCSGPALKSLRESSPIERGMETAAVAQLITELEHVRSRALAPASTREAQPRFGDYLAGEQLGERWEEWKDLFVASFPGYEDVVSKSILVLTGTRGCGKTMVFRRLSALLNFQVGHVDEGASRSFVGFYLNMNGVGDAFLLDERSRLNGYLARRVIQFFHLCLLEEIARVAGVAREKALEAERGAHEIANLWFFNHVLSLIGADRSYPGSAACVSVVVSELEKAKDELRASPVPSARLRALGDNDWLARLVPALQVAMPWIQGRPVYFFLDDYSLPRVPEALQKILNSVIFRRSDSFFFKISTESANTLYRHDYSGKELQDPHDFELTDLGSITIDWSDEDREDFLDEVFRRRFAREARLRGRTLLEVLGEFDRSWTQLAREIRREPVNAGDEPAEPDRRRRVLYYGRRVFVNMWSGDTRTLIRIALNLLDQLPAGVSAELPIPKRAQDKVFRRIGGEFLSLLQACVRIKRRRAPNLPRHMLSWGPHLVKIAEGFKQIALHDLRTLDGGRGGRREPRQAFRIEIVDQFDLEGIERELYEDLVRYGVFLRDDRGKSVRGAIIPRLYLRRLLVPFCTLSFSKVDNIPMSTAAFREFLLHPDQFASRWQKKRGELAPGQKHLFG